jgi:hypothetical protein
MTFAANIPRHKCRSVSLYDGHVEIFLRSIEGLGKAAQNPDCPAQISPEEHKFLDQSRLVVTVGREDGYVRGGKILI